MHSDQFKPKSHLKLNKKYIFSEAEQFPLKGTDSDKAFVEPGHFTYSTEYSNTPLLHIKRYTITHWTFTFLDFLQKSSNSKYVMHLGKH